MLSKICDGKCGQGRSSGPRYVCPHNNLKAVFPQLAEEWDSSNLKPPDWYAIRSDTLVMWKCPINPCGCHIYPARITARTDIYFGGPKNGCPYCSHRKLCKHNNLLALNPTLCLEWDTEKNEKSPDQFPPVSDKMIWWKCLINPEHQWKTTILCRNGSSAGHRSGCPYCSKFIADPSPTGNNLLAMHPELCKEWDFDKNPPPQTFTPQSHKKVWWVCSVNHTHRWQTQVCHRTSKNQNGCPHCTISRGYSKLQIAWLDKIMLEENIKIQYALTPEGEFKIPKIGSVDGYCHETFTVYEFHGDFWHGNPLRYDPNDINPVCKTPFKELYRKTIKREDKIRMLGYRLIVQWETPF